MVNPTQPPGAPGPISLETIAEQCGGKLIGDPDIRVCRVASINSATQDSLTFLVNPRHLDSSYDLQPGVVLIKPEHHELLDCNKILVDDPYLAYAKISALFVSSAGDLTEGVHDSAVVDPSVILGRCVRVGAGAVIGQGSVIGDHASIGHRCVIEAHCHVGDHSRLEASVTLCAGTRLGRRCVISPGVVIGASGFGYAPEDKQWCKIHQLGAVTIGDDVDVGANTTIDRGAIDDTVIGHRVKLDNQIQIAHNVQVGDDTIMAGCVAIAGSAVIGKRCQLGGRASVLGHLEIADDVVLNANAFVAQSIRKAGVYSSMIPAQPIGQWRKTVAHLNRLEKLVERIKKTGK
ncbi:MAG: UDP-3-O-(3-hydroxymyristoyl)glucosamine N-acyltransferase [bacterium]